MVGDGVPGIPRRVFEQLDENRPAVSREPQENQRLDWPAGVIVSEHTGWEVRAQLHAGIEDRRDHRAARDRVRIHRGFERVFEIRDRFVYAEFSAVERTPCDVRWIA